VAALLAVTIGARADDSRGVAADRLSGATVQDAYARLSPAFLENRGQIDRRVHYYALGSGHAFYVTRKGVELSLVRSAKPAGRGVTLAWRFAGANPHVTLQAQERLAGTVNSFHGNDRARWRTGLPRHAQVRPAGASRSRPEGRLAPFRLLLFRMRKGHDGSSRRLLDEVEDAHPVHEHHRPAEETAQREETETDERQDQ
jgi:hypothetical protein